MNHCIIACDWFNRKKITSSTMLFTEATSHHSYAWALVAFLRKTFAFTLLLSCNLIVFVFEFILLLSCNLIVFLFAFEIEAPAHACHAWDLVALLRKTFVAITGLEGRLFCQNIFTIYCTNNTIINNHHTQNQKVQSKLLKITAKLHCQLMGNRETQVKKIYLRKFRYNLVTVK